MKKILFTGTTSSGKTTLMKKLAEMTQIDNGASTKLIELIPEVARELLTAHPDLEQEAGLQDILFEEQLRREIAAETRSPDLLFCDRGVLDIVAHARLFGQPVKQEWLDWTRNAYDDILLFEKDDIAFQVNALQQKIGERDWVTFRQRLDEEIMRAIEESQVSWRKITGSVEARLEILMQLIEVSPRSPEGQPRSRKECR